MMRQTLARAALTGLSVVASSAACSPPIQGEILIVVETDMSVPKDIDMLAIEHVYPDGTVVPDDGPWDLFDPEDDTKRNGIKLPGTLGFKVSSYPGATVTFRVSASKGGKPRVLREVMTTIPVDRAAMLRMPLQWLCADKICNKGDTCRNGDCEKIEVIPELDLLPYEATKVFGSDFGGELGACFDTSSCLKGGRGLTPEEKDGKCVISWDGGPRVNVAISTETDGICGPDGCFVPLDAESDQGWKSVPEKNLIEVPLIEVPMAVCTKRTEGEAIKVVVQSVDTCGGLVKREGIPPCGAWSSVGPPGQPPGIEEPVTLAALQNRPIGIAAGDVSSMAGVKIFNVFWTNAGSPYEASGAVRMIPIGGGKKKSPLTPEEEEKEASPQQITFGRVGNKPTIFWTNRGITEDKMFENEVGGGVFFAGIDDMVREPLALGKEFEGIALSPPTSEPRAYFTKLDNGAIYEEVASTADGIPDLVIGQDAVHKPYRVVVDDDHIFWTNTQKGTVMMAPRGAPVPAEEWRTLAMDQEAPYGIALALEKGKATAVFWTNFADPGSVMKANVLTGDVSDFVSDLKFPKGIFVDNDNGFVYWTSGDLNGWVKSKPLSDLDPSDGDPVASNQVRPGAIFVLNGLLCPDGISTATNVFWINEGTPMGDDGAVMKKIICHP